MVCLDIDNGPDWTVTNGNRELHGPGGLDLIDRVLAPAGVLSVWSAMPAPDFTRLLETRFARVQTLEVPVLPGRRGEPDVVFLAARRFHDAGGQLPPSANEPPASSTGRKPSLTANARLYIKEQ